jgi:hypothetical protein
MNQPFLELDASLLLATVAARIPPALRDNVVVIGSVATAWAFRDVSGMATVATKDIDLLLRPTVDAVATAVTLGQRLLDEGWMPQFSEGREAGTADTPDDQLPALRLTPPGMGDGWFIELLAEPAASQTERRTWRRVDTAQGAFGLPSFRFMPIATHGAQETPFGLLVARPACMALAHLLEHAEPDHNRISTQSGFLRFQKDLGRAVSLWWLAGEQAASPGPVWLAAWHAALDEIHPGRHLKMVTAAQSGLRALDGYLREAHRLSTLGVLAPHGTSFDAFKRACESLGRLLDNAAKTGQER